MFALQTLDNRQADWTDGKALLALRESKAAVVDVNIAPQQIDDLTATAARHCDEAADVNSLWIVRRRRMQHLAKRRIFLFAYSPLSYGIV
jgi:hypothetical protein